MENLWIDQGSSGKLVTDARKMLTTLDCVELKEVYSLRNFWDVVGSHDL